MAVKVNLAPLVDQLIKGPLTHFYFYTGSSTRSSAFTQDDSLVTIQSLFQTAANCEVIDHSYTLQGNRFKQIELKFASKTIFLKEVVEEGFNPKIWNPNSTLLILPGGEASELEKQIGEQYQSLLTFVKQGGLLWGVCGAAYWLSKVRTFVFSPGEAKTVTNLNALFPGCSYGPLPFPIPPQQHYEFQVTTPSIKTSTSYISPTFLAGGGYFELPLVTQTPIEIFARYEDEWLQNKIAAVCCTHNKGIVLLMHPHVMHNNETIDVPSFSQLLSNRGNWREIEKTLKDSQNTRMCFVAHVILTLCEKKSLL